MAKFKKYEGVFGGLDKQSLTYVFYDEGLFSSFFSELDVFLNYKVTWIAVFRDGKLNDRTAHAFVVFQTDKYSYSVERGLTGVVMQISENIEDVIFSYRGRKRQGYIRETDWVDGEGTVGDLVELIKRKVLLEKYHLFLRNCQTFASLILKKCSKEGKTFHKYRVHNQKHKIPSFGLCRIKALINSLL